MADVNWNLAVTPDPFKQIAEGANYSKQIFDQAALLKAGSQYAAGDPASAANTVASRGDFATAGKLQDLGTARTAGAQYAAGDPGAAAKTYATAGDFESAQKLQDYDIKKITAQQELFQQAVPYLDDAITQGHDPGATFDIIAPLMKGRGVPDQTIAQTRASFIANPKATIGALSALAKAQWLKAGDDQVLVDGTGKERARIKGGASAADQLRAANSPFNADGTPNLAYQQQQLDLRRAGRPETNVNVNTANKPFFGDLGGIAAKQFGEDRTTAQAAANAIAATNEARSLLDSGAFTGAFANWKLGAAKRLGLGDNEVANTEAFQSAMGRQTLGLVRQLGAGSGISNADRDYADKVAGGNITLNDTSLRRILDINERANRAVIQRYNKAATRVQGSPAMAEFPVDLSVQEPEANQLSPPPGAANALPIPQAAIDKLQEGVISTFGNGQRWTLKNGQPVQVR